LQVCIALSLVWQLLLIAGPMLGLLVVGLQHGSSWQFLKLPVQPTFGAGFLLRNYDSLAFDRLILSALCEASVATGPGYVWRVWASRQARYEAVHSRACCVLPVWWYHPGRRDAGRTASERWLFRCGSGWRCWFAELGGSAGIVVCLVVRIVNDSCLY
jgi:hypothetical protein